MARRPCNSFQIETRLLVIYVLHEDAENDLREAAAFYRDQAGVTLSLAFERV